MKVSIIIPQTSAYLRFYATAVESIRSQNRPINVITVQADGMSVGKATNAGVEKSDTEYVMRLDCDDYLHHLAIQIMQNHLDAHPNAAAVYSDYWHTDEEGIPLSVQDQSPTSPTATPPHPGCMMIRRSAFNEIRGFDETLTRQEGTDFYYRLTKHRQVDHIDLALWFYRHHDSQMSNAHNEVIQARHEVKEMHQKEGERILAIIPARGGSKGIPRKNLIKLDGLPLVTHAIRMAKSSKHDMMIALSTEDEEIAQVGLDEGIAVLHRDPKDAEDEVNLITVAKHAMESMDNTYRADIVVTIQPTSPGTPVAALDNALSRMLGAPLTMKPGGSGIFNVDAVVCMSEPRGKHPFRLYSRTGEADFTPFFPDKAERYLQRQDRELAYQFTGGFYCRRRHLLEAWDGEGFALGRWEGELVTKEQGIDIDDALDLHLARAFLEEKI